MLSYRPIFCGCFFVIALSIVLWSELAYACAMCQTVLPRGEDSLGQGLLWSGLILLTAPFVVTGMIGGWVYYQFSRGDAETRRIQPGDVS
ncbi:MAG: hypothetical protein HOP18_27505 [Deltaproteobacteria bacterium]|nr:hypothetical protein [Deltaproteobacteria bacterium]